MKYFVVADVHGFYNEMIDALGKAGFDPKNENHFFISCGDLFDRGKQPNECLDFVLSLDPARRAFVRGNHEDLMEKMVIRGYPDEIDYHNGTIQTAMMLNQTANEKVGCLAMQWNDKYRMYTRELRNFFEVGDYIFVHGWIPCQKKMSGYAWQENWRDADLISWDAARWVNGMSAWINGVKEDGKTIVCGHWHTSWGYAYIRHMGREWPTIDGDKMDMTNVYLDAFEDDGIVALDGCTVLSKKVNVFTFEMDA